MRRSARLSYLVAFCVLFLAAEVGAQDAPVVDAPVVDAPVVDAPVVDAPVVEAPVAEAPSEEEEFEGFVARQAALEVQLGLRFYTEFDDYRAITALRRYRFLDGTPKSAFLSSLMIGQIYHRNEKPDLAVLAFEEASKVATRPYDRNFAYLMAVQEMCLPLSFYAQCRQRLAALAQAPMEPALRELVDYQVLYTDVVLRSEYVTPRRLEVFSEPTLAGKAQGLVAANEEFHDIGLKRPWLSGTLSALLPGAGQLYNGRPWDAVISLLVNGAFGAATYFSFAEARSIPLGVVSAVFLAGFYSGNIVNAVTDARKINAERYLAFFEQLKADYWPRVSFRIDSNAVLFTYGFDWPGPTLDSRARDLSEPAAESESP